MFVDGGNELLDSKMSSYEEAMNALSSLITTRSRADKSNSGDRFDLLFDYIKVIFLLDEVLHNFNLLEINCFSDC